jgi:hypothetical protein
VSRTPFLAALPFLASALSLASVERVVPIVLDVSSGSARYTTELTLANIGAEPLAFSAHYEASLGSREGTGTVTDALAAGEQRVVPDVLAWLREKGLAIPAALAQPQQGGVLVLTFPGATADRIEVTARTASPVAAPHPEGRAGLAYGAVAAGSTGGPRTLYGLRENGAERTNLAVFNTGSGPVSVRISVRSSRGDGAPRVVRELETLPAFGWMQVTRVLQGTGIEQGSATIERVSASGTFDAYAVVNDEVTNDGSFLAPASTAPGERIVVPVLVETPRFRSELVLANGASAPVTLRLGYREALSPGAGAGGSVSLSLGAGEQRILSDALAELRRAGLPAGAAGQAPYAGALVVEAESGSLAGVWAGAKTSAPSPGGGAFGVFTPGVPESATAAGSALLTGLCSDGGNRTNVAVVHAGIAADGPLTLRISFFDGNGGAPRGVPETVVLEPGAWRQLEDPLRSRGVASGWARIERLSGEGRWLGYAVVNDGASPGARTGDGAYVPMQLPKSVSSGPLVYVGAFRLEGSDEGNDRRLGYSEGVVALDGAGSIWVAGHTYTDLFAPFPIPSSLGATLRDAPVVAQAGPWQDLTKGAQAQITADRNVRGLLRVGAGWLTTVQEYYNADGSHDGSLAYEGHGLWKTTHHSQATAGFLAPVHPEWKGRLGVEWFSGLAGTPIHQLSSHGPTAHGFSFDPARLPAPGETVVTKRLVFYPLDQEHPDFTDVSSIRGAAFESDAVYFFGTKGLGAHWYGEVSEGGKSDPCAEGKGYHAEGRATWLWVVDPREIERVNAAGGDPRIPTIRSESLDALLGLTGPCPAILGATHDVGTGLVYVSTPDQERESGEPQPAIHVLATRPSGASRRLH